MREHTCVRFVKSGNTVRMGELIIEINGRRSQTSSEQTLWICKDCRGTVWLETGIDPNVQTAAQVRPVKKLRK